MGQELLCHRMQDFNEDILKFLICPRTGGELLYDKRKTFFILDKKNIYKIKNGVPILTIDNEHK